MVYWLNLVLREPYTLALKNKREASLQHDKEKKQLFENHTALVSDFGDKLQKLVEEFKEERERSFRVLCCKDW